jgi:NAD(P)-dependent dehydrogenase (short-subunit alcohol dehydrogenase family)
VDFGLSGKRALVTGSSSGIGAEIARVLAREGASVVVHGRDEGRAMRVAEQIIAERGKAAVVCGDLQGESSTLALAKAADAAFSGIDILINNAASRAEGTTGFDIPPEEWLKTYERNVLSAVRLAKYFAPQMRERGWGRIVQISSAMGTTPIGVVPDYSSSKAALNNFSLNLSKALANTGITVNTVSPGLIWTPANEAFFADLAVAMGLGNDVQKALDHVLKEHARQSVGRVGQPRDIAAGVAYLASPLADFVNGTNLRIDGGHSASLN